MTKRFTASFTVDLDLEEELTKTLSDEIAKEIDLDIIKSIEIDHLVKQGWTKVELDRFKHLQQAVDIAIWVEDNCGPHMRHGKTFVFKEAKDATWFRLKWVQ